MYLDSFYKMDSKPRSLYFTLLYRYDSYPSKSRLFSIPDTSSDKYWVRELLILRNWLNIVGYYRCNLHCFHIIVKSWNFWRIWNNLALEILKIIICPLLSVVYFRNAAILELKTQRKLSTWKTVL